MPSASDILADETTAHLFALLRVSAGLRVKALQEIESLFAELTKHAEKFGGLKSAKGAAFKELEEEAGAIIKAAYKVIQKGQLSDLEKIAVSEGDFATAAMNKAVGVNIYTKALDPRVLEAIAGGKIIEGHPLSEWWTGQSADLRRKFSGEVAKGILLGEPIATIVKRIQGDTARPSDMKKTAQRNATALVRTSVMAVSNTARIESLKAMGTVKGIQWLSTLDRRTTVICIGLDGKQWRFPDFAPIGHDKKFPGPIAHIQCRSTQTGITYTWSELAGKKLPEFKGRDVQQEIDRKMRADGEPEERVAAALANARASMDGPVRASHTFDSWAKENGPEFVTAIVGPGRAELLRANRITMAELTDQDNRPLTITQLRESISTGKPPPETLGRQFVPYRPEEPATAVKIQEIAEAARLEAEEQAAKAERQARELLTQLATAKADAHQGPYGDARTVLEDEATKTAAELREAWENAATGTVENWLKAWENGQASPHNPDARPNRLRREAWERYAKGLPKTLDTWERLWKGWQDDKAGEPFRRAMTHALEAMERAQAQLVKVQNAKGEMGERELQAAMLDALGALADAQSKLQDAMEVAE